MERWRMGRPPSPGLCGTPKQGQEHRPRDRQQHAAGGARGGGAEPTVLLLWAGSSLPVLFLFLPFLSPGACNVANAKSK